MTFSELNREVDEIERRLAYGSETAIYGHYVDHMSRLGGEDFRESGDEVPGGNDAWWLAAYEAYEADLALPEGQRAESCQELFDRVHV